MAIIKDFSTPQGIAANYHKLVKVEVSAVTGTVEMMVAIYASFESAQEGSSPLWNEYLRVPIDQFVPNPFAAFYPILTTYPGSYLVGGANDAAPAASVFEVTDPTDGSPIPSLLDQMKEVRTQQMRGRRDQLEFGTFTWDGSVFDATAVSVGRIMGAVMMSEWATKAGQTFSVSWTLADNTERTLSATDIVGVAQALGAHTLGVHEAYKTVKAAIQAATTIEDVRLVDWPVS